jgi:hypothetical protein
MPKREPGSLQKPSFTNSAGVKNKDQGGSVQYQSENKSLQKPSFTNSAGVKKDFNKPYVADRRYAAEGDKNKDFTKPYVSDKRYAAEGDKNTINKQIGVTKDIFSKVNEENQKVKAPKRDYLESEFGTGKGKEDPQMEKPRFVNKHVGDSSHPHFVDINKSEDVY